MTDMNEMSPRLRQDFFARVSENSKKILWTGIAMVVVGLIAIIFPFIASVAVTLMAGILFLITGFVTLYGAFSVQGTWAFIGALLLGLLQLIAGVYVLFNPLAGLIVFTLVIAAMFIVEGIFKIIFAFKIKPEEGWGWALVSGLISIILGVLIYSEWPGSSLVIIGLLMGINFLFSGFYMIMIANKFKATA